jgi:hypothetical protein
MQEWIAYNRKASCKIANVLWKKTKLAYLKDIVFMHLS